MLRSNKLTPALIKRELCWLILQLDWKPPKRSELEKMIGVQIDAGHSPKPLLVIDFQGLNYEGLPGQPIETTIYQELERGDLSARLYDFSQKYLVLNAWRVCVRGFPKEVLNYWSA